MFEDLFKRLKEKKALREWQRSSLGRVLAAHVNEYFSKYPRFSGMEADDKQETVGELFRQVAEVLQAENPGMKLRESLANLVLAFAEQVLCLTEEEKRGQVYADCPYISGELYRFIERAVPHVELLRELKWKNPEFSNENLVGVCNMRSGRILFYLNGLNHVRYEFKDYDKQKDWFQPFLRAMLIWYEDNHRQKMGLPSLLPDEMDGLKHSTFMNMVVNGVVNPYYEWEKAWVPGTA
jgi:hypothetical protein